MRPRIFTVAMIAVALIVSMLPATSEACGGRLLAKLFHHHGGQNVRQQARSEGNGGLFPAWRGARKSRGQFVWFPRSNR